MCIKVFDWLQSLFYMVEGSHKIVSSKWIRCKRSRRIAAGIQTRNFNPSSQQGVGRKRPIPPSSNGTEHARRQTAPTFSWAEVGIILEQMKNKATSRAHRGNHDAICQSEWLARGRSGRGKPPTGKRQRARSPMTRGDLHVC